jgi:hypothetical protein
MNQTITNNAIMIRANHPLTPLRRRGRNSVQQIENQVIGVIQDILGYM